MTATTVASRVSTTWKTVTIGTQRSVEDLEMALTGNGFRICYWAGDILKKVTLAKTKTEIELVLISVEDLGFTKPARCDVIYERAKELGLDLVPAEVGPQLRLAYTDQTVYELIFMAMKPILTSDNGLLVFTVVCQGDGPWLGSSFGYPDFVWGLGRRWVFARRKQS